MARKRSYRGVKSTSKPKEVHLNVPEDKTNSSLEDWAKVECHRYYLCNSTSVGYGLLILYLMTAKDKYFEIGRPVFLPFLLIHTLFECSMLRASMFPDCHRIWPNGRFCVTYASAFVTIYTFAVLMGAGFASNMFQTATFSLTLITFTIYPLYFYFGPACLSHLLLQEKTVDLVRQSVLTVAWSVIIGAWCGAFFIPLDWGRPWQVWPIPCTISSVVGYVVGNAISFVRLINYNWPF